jgi:hypothetical protein
MEINGRLHLHTQDGEMLITKRRTELVVAGRQKEYNLESNLESASHSRREPPEPPVDH